MRYLPIAGPTHDLFPLVISRWQAKRSAAPAHLADVFCAIQRQCEEWQDICHTYRPSAAAGAGCRAALPRRQLGRDAEPWLPTISPGTASSSTSTGLVVDLQMNLVRLPLSAEWINGNMAADNYICGEYRYIPTLSVLDDVLERLAARGVFVMLDMHTLHLHRNFPLWCDPEPCDDASEQAIFAAWATVPSRSATAPSPM